MRFGSLAALMVIVVAPLGAQQVASPAGPVSPVRPPSISTTAQGEARVTPDRATIYIGVQTRAATAAQASAENARKQRAVIDTLHAMGIPEAQISTTSFNVYPEQSFQPDKGDRAPRIVGYNVTNTVRVEVRKIDQLGRLLDAALAKGANSINSLDFSSSNEDEARRQALAQAVQRARADAEALAHGAGGRLGDLVELSSIPMSGGPRPLVGNVMGMARAEVAPTPISAGEETITVSVVARWRFVGGEK